MAVTNDQRKMLDFEREWWKYAGAKEQAIRTQFGLEPAEYYRRLHAVIATDEALGYDPMLVKRLRRLQAQRERQRAAREARQASPGL